MELSEDQPGAGVAAVRVAAVRVVAVRRRVLTAAAVSHRGDLRLRQHPVVVDAVEIDPVAGGLLVLAEPLPQVGEGFLRRAQRHPRQVVHRIAGVGEFPVDDRRHAVVGEHEVAGAGVALDEDRPAVVRRDVLAQPPQRDAQFGGRDAAPEGDHARPSRRAGGGRDRRSSHRTRRARVRPRRGACRSASRSMKSCAIAVARRGSWIIAKRASPSITPRSSACSVGCRPRNRARRDGGRCPGPGTPPPRGAPSTGRRSRGDRSGPSAGTPAVRLLSSANSTSQPSLRPPPAWRVADVTVERVVCFDPRSHVDRKRRRRRHVSPSCRSPGAGVAEI